MHMVLQQEASSHSHLLIYVGIHHIDWSKASIFNEKFDCRCVCVLVVCVGAKRWRRLEGRKSCRRSNSSNFKHWHSFFFLFNYYSAFTFLLESFAFLPFCCCAHSVHSRDMFRTSGMREMMKTVVDGRDRNKKQNRRNIKANKRNRRGKERERVRRSVGNIKIQKPSPHENIFYLFLLDVFGNTVCVCVRACMRACICV